MDSKWIDRLRNFLFKFKGEEPNVPSWWVTIKGMVYQTGGDGPSMTKGAYGLVCLTMGFCMTVLICAFAWVYIRWHKADGVVAGLIFSLAGLYMTFASLTKQKKNKEQIHATTVLGVNDANPPTTATSTIDTTV